MKRQCNYEVVGKVVAAEGQLADQVVGRTFKGTLSVRGRKEWFEVPSGKSFLVSGVLQEYPLKDYFGGKDLVLEEVPWLCQGYEVNETFDAPGGLGKLTATIAQDWSAITGIKAQGSPKGEYALLLRNVKVEAEAKLTSVVDKEDEPVCGIRADFATPVFLLNDIEGMRGTDLSDMRRKYNVLFGCLDLALPVGNGWEGVCRPHIQAGVSYDRSGRRRVLDFAVRNIRFAASLGYEVILVNANEPTVRKGRSRFMAGWGFQDGIEASDIYTDSNLESEIGFWDDLLQRCGDVVCGIELVLEPMESASIRWSANLASRIRSMGYEGKLYTGGIGDGWWGGDSVLGVGTIGGSKDIEKWKRFSLPWTDGWDMTQQEAEEWVPKLTANPGKDGWCMYFLTDSPEGLDKYERWMTDLVA